ncbi:PAS domain-containing protein [Pedobacter fastidiosus]|uniref:histidine kinase n=1 Tax=Pedobacter fastidiosus TaxID=2765361 RepID=A0ABR7KV35_9SPHI|nr:PAS domain-containing protein [Pedobacter fastidiosus]MBC6111622.1 PAS domain-containing protein [Pedobacter fastidiosus]
MVFAINKQTYYSLPLFIMDARINAKKKDLSMICDAHWDVIFDHVKLGFWEFQYESGILRTSFTCKRNYGLSADASFTFDDLLSMILPEDLDKMQDEIQLTISGERSSYNVQYRIKRADGAIRTIKADGIVVRELGEISKMIGTSLDITDLSNRYLV